PISMCSVPPGFPGRRLSPPTSTISGRLGSRSASGGNSPAATRSTSAGFSCSAGPAAWAAGAAISRRSRARRRKGEPRGSCAAGVGIEPLLAVDPIAGNGALALRRDQPVDEGLAVMRLDMGKPLGIDQDNAVLIEQPRIALDQRHQVPLVLERQPSGAVG